MVEHIGALLRTHTKAVRVTAWLAFVPLAGLYALAWTSSSAAGVAIRILAFVIAPACAFLGSLFAYRVSARGTAERAFWGLCSLATGFLFLSEAYYGAYQLAVDMRGPPAMSLFDLLNACAAVSFLAVVALMVRRRSRGVLSTATGLTIVLALVALLYVGVYRWVAEPLVHALGRSPILAAIWAAYMLTGAALILGSLVSLVGHRDVRTSGWQKVICVALAIYGAVVTVWPAMHLAQGMPTRTPIELLLNIGYMAGYYVFFIGAVYWVTDVTPEPAALLAGSAPSTARANLVATSISLASLPILAWWVHTSAPRSVDRALYFTVAEIVTVLAVLRTVLADVQSVWLSRLESSDELSGVLNRRGFDDRLAESVSAAVTRGTPVSLIILDVDDFAKFNVLEGRDAGDGVLRRLADRLAGLAASSGVVGRHGGDEFAVLLPDCSKAEAVALAREMTAIPSAPGGPPSTAVRLSAGVASVPEDAHSSSVLLEYADAALYWAKCQGKGRVVGFDDVVRQALRAESRIRGIHERSRLDIVRALAAATDARDAAAAYHSRQVASVTALVCERLGLDETRTNEVQTAALLHDVGKVAVPDSVLRKRSRLSPGERAVLREHAELGARILEATELSFMAPWVRSHHEHWDGSGYPDGLAGEQIPLEARIIGACNLYELIISGSPERGPLSRESALQELDQGLGSVLDPRVGEALIEVVGGSRSLGWSEAWLR